MRLAEGAIGCTVPNTDLRLPAGIAGNRDPWAVLRGCEGPQPDAKVASDPGAPSHFAAKYGDRPATKKRPSLVREKGGRKSALKGRSRGCYATLRPREMVRPARAGSNLRVSAILAAVASP
jgi:hypothetical protein